MTWSERLRKTRRKLVKKNGRRLLQALDRYLGSRSLVGDHPFFDPAQFPAVATLEANWRPIRVELERLLAAREHIPPFHAVSPDQKRISEGDNWKTFILFGFGRKRAAPDEHVANAVRYCEKPVGTPAVLQGAEAVSRHLEIHPPADRQARPAAARGRAPEDIDRHEGRGQGRRCGGRRGEAPVP